MREISMVDGHLAKCKTAKENNQEEQVSDHDAFEAQVRKNIADLGADKQLQGASRRWILDSSRHGYTYNFSWLGLPVIQYPQDLIAMQEIIWRVKPDLIVETGVARGGSLLFYASMLQLLGGERRVIGVDIEIRPHNRAALESHPLSKSIRLLEGSSVDSKIVERVREHARGASVVLVTLDSNHTHAHVLAELRAYAPLVSQGSYLVVFDTCIEDMPEGTYPGKPWGKGNNPRTAVQAYLAESSRFVVDADVDNKLLITVAGGGYLRCVAA